MNCYSVEGKYPSPIGEKVSRHATDEGLMAIIERNAIKHYAANCITSSAASGRTFS